LVYIAAFQPDEGESLASLGERMPGASKAVRPIGNGFLVFDPALFHADFAADLPANAADFMARSQVFLSVKSATAKMTSPAWKTKPSFAVVATNDRVINPDLERFMYKRSNATVVEIAGSHAVFAAQPAKVAALIERAAR
jgi:pimeloyl-ACP methyl ester carboxylesterase